LIVPCFSALAALEFLGGKCVPKRCPLHTCLKDGKCIGSSDKAFDDAGSRAGAISYRQNRGRAGGDRESLSVAEDHRGEAAT